MHKLHIFHLKANFYFFSLTQKQRLGNSGKQMIEIWYPL